MLMLPVPVNPLPVANKRGKNRSMRLVPAAPKSLADRASSRSRRSLVTLLYPNGLELTVVMPCTFNTSGSLSPHETAVQAVVFISGDQGRVGAQEGLLCRGQQVSAARERIEKDTGCGAQFIGRVEHISDHSIAAPMVVLFDGRQDLRVLAGFLVAETVEFARLVC